jgi:hypothetical protein
MDKRTQKMNQELIRLRNAYAALKRDLEIILEGTKLATCDNCAEEYPVASMAGGTCVKCLRVLADRGGAKELREKIGAIRKLAEKAKELLGKWVIPKDIKDVILEIATEAERKTDA